MRFVSFMSKMRLSVISYMATVGYVFYSRYITFYFLFYRPQFENKFHLFVLRIHRCLRIFCDIFNGKQSEEKTVNKWNILDIYL